MRQLLAYRVMISLASFIYQRRKEEVKRVFLLDMFLQVSELLQQIPRVYKFDFVNINYLRQ
jgi:hypothetical protein